MSRAARLSVRAVIVRDGALLLVNAWKGRTDLWCAPGGGVEPHLSLPDNLRREVREETGLEIDVGAPCLVNEFHDPEGPFHQVDLYFRCTVIGEAELSADWVDPEGIVSHRRWVSQADLADMAVKPDSLAAIAWTQTASAHYDPLEPIVR